MEIQYNGNTYLVRFVERYIFPEIRIYCLRKNCRFFPKLVWAELECITRQMFFSEHPDANPEDEDFLIRLGTYSFEQYLSNIEERRKEKKILANQKKRFAKSKVTKEIEQK